MTKGPSIPLTALPLTVGDHGPEVAELRRRLHALGFDTGDGGAEDFDDATSRALAAFQASRGLECTGACDPSTWSAVIESEYALGDRLVCLRTPMMRGDDVAELQLRLGTLGFDSGRVDGIFGPMTQAAVGAFQRNAGIIYDQVCGPDTVEALRRLEGRAGNASVTSVRERITLLRGVSELSSLRVALGARDAGDRLASRLAADLRTRCSALALVDGEWSAQALATNDFGADVYLGVEEADGDGVEALYFAVSGFESVGGRALAELVVRELPAAPGGLGVVRGMRLPILRETKAPAVLVKAGRDLDETQRDLLLVGLQRALERWSREPFGTDDAPR